ncbi:hypothetical protein HNR44_000672 [Geomicrobium halophilum]|uniref:Uncharacterized protein n=1 Tax=Geomicrobium halophilum TaxID=549000 RepID=A0A841PWL2_9BACL|nr:hypothetical protein [Geomicrobium halophilum]
MPLGVKDRSILFLQEDPISINAEAEKSPVFPLTLPVFRRVYVHPYEKYLLYLISILPSLKI